MDAAAAEVGIVPDVVGMEAFGVSAGDGSEDAAPAVLEAPPSPASRGPRVAVIGAYRLELRHLRSLRDQHSSPAQLSWLPRLVLHAW